MGTVLTQYGVICKKEEGFQRIGEVVKIDDEQDWAQDTALGISSLHWGGVGGRGEVVNEVSIDSNMLTA